MKHKIFSFSLSAAMNLTRISANALVRDWEKQKRKNKIETSNLDTQKEKSWDAACIRLKGLGKVSVGAVNITLKGILTEMQS